MTIPKPKKDAVRSARYAEGGDDRMFRQQAAGPAPSGRTGKTQTAAPGAKSAKGEPPTRGVAGVVPATPGRTAPLKRR
jgi:hypothetical protein